MDTGEIVEIFPYLIMVCGLVSAAIIYFVEFNARNIFTGSVEFTRKLAGKSVSELNRVDATGNSKDLKNTYWLIF